MSLLTCSHLVVATDDVSRMVRFFSTLFAVKPHFENDMFVDFVLPSRFRVAFFKPVGTAAKYFTAIGPRGHVSFGVTTTDVEALHRRASEKDLVDLGVTMSGPPKEHPWGEKSFLLIDPDGNRWEITESPSQDGLLVNRD